MTDKRLYAVLGAAVDATPAQIKRAYRKLVKKHHPDVGGDVEVFKEIGLAWATLSDPERRAKYDATGDLGEPDNERARALGFIAGVMESLLLDPKSLRHQNMVLSVLEVLRITHAATFESLAMLSETRMHLERLVDRVQPVSPGAVDVITPMIRSRINDVADQIGRGNDQQRLLDKAIKMLEGLEDYPELTEMDHWGKMKPLAERVT